MLDFSETGTTIAYLGDTKKGHFPEACSVKIAKNLSTDPRIALWIMTGLLNPGLTAYSFHSKSSFEYSSFGKS